MVSRRPRPGTRIDAHVAHQPRAPGSDDDDVSMPLNPRHLSALSAHIYGVLEVSIPSHLCFMHSKILKTQAPPTSLTTERAGSFEIYTCYSQRKGTSCTLPLLSVTHISTAILFFCRPSTHEERVKLYCPSSECASLPLPYFEHFRRNHCAAYQFSSSCSEEITSPHFCAC